MVRRKARSGKLTAADKSKDNDGEVLNRVNQRQPAQNRLKRLQRSLETPFEMRDNSSGRHVPPKNILSSDMNIESAFKQCTLNSRPTQMDSIYSFVKGPKSKALNDVSNRRTHYSNTAQQRLHQLCESLQQKQQQIQNATNNNDKEIVNQKSSLCKDSNESKEEIEDSMDIDEDLDSSDQLIKGASPPKKPKAAMTDDCDWEMVELPPIGDLPTKSDYMYFVVDTNIILEDHRFLLDLCKLSIAGTGGIMIFLPYMIIKELDNLKMRRNNPKLSKAAVRSIHALNALFDNGANIQGQSAIQEAEHLITVDTADDSIINCCLQLKRTVSHLTLVTNDANMRLKANVSYIHALSRNMLILKYDMIRDGAS